MFRVLADNHHATLAFDDFTFLAYRFYARSNFHCSSPFVLERLQLALLIASAIYFAK